jgi:hypothetical protein
LTTRDVSRNEAHKRLERFYSAWHVENHRPEFGPAFGTSLRDELVEPGLPIAALWALWYGQDDLRELKSPVEAKQAGELMRERLWALTALIEIGGQRSAKAALLDITGGNPLTVCLGDAYRVRSRKWQKKTVTTAGFGEVGLTVVGCLAIFPDAAHATGGEVWPGFCDSCRSSSSKPHRDQRTAIKRRLDRMWAGDTAKVYRHYISTFDDA